MLLGSNSGQDGGKSKRGVGPEIAQRHPQDWHEGVDASLDGSVNADADVYVNPD